MYYHSINYHDDEGVDGDLLIVQLFSHDQDAALWVKVEVLGAVWVEAAVDGVDQLAVNVRILGVDLQDVLPGRRVLGNPDLKDDESQCTSKSGKRLVISTITTGSSLLFLHRCPVRGN